MTVIDITHHADELISESKVLKSTQVTDEIDEYDKLESQMSKQLQDLQAEYESLELEAQRLRW